MPVIKSAIKKLRKDRNREKRNDVFRAELDKTLKNAKKTKTAKAVSAAVSIVDRAVKKKLLHKNRAARIKSSLSALAKPGAKAKSVAKPTKAKISKTKAKKTPKK